MLGDVTVAILGDCEIEPARFGGGACEVGERGAAKVDATGEVKAPFGCLASAVPVG